MDNNQKLWASRIVLVMCLVADFYLYGKVQQAGYAQAFSDAPSHLGIWFSLFMASIAASLFAAVGYYIYGARRRAGVGSKTKERVEVEMLAALGKPAQQKQPPGSKEPGGKVLPKKRAN
jgi:hypothetical protein